MFSSRFIFVLFLFIQLINFTFGQKNSLKIFIQDSSNNSQYTIRTEAIKKQSALNAFRNKMIAKGYLLTSLSQIDSTSYRLDLGKRFSTLEIKSLDGKIAYKQPKDYRQFLSQRMNVQTNRGYPFYAIYLDSIIIGENSISAQVRETLGPFVSWTQLHAQADSSINERMLENLTGIKAGDCYQESKIINLSKRLNQYNYLEVIKPTEILFTKEGAELFSYIRYKKMSSFQGAVGVQPNPLTQRVGLTGELQLKLLNVLKRAELLDIHWRSIQIGTSNLSARCALPFLFQSPFGIDGKLQLYKRDSSFFEFKGNLAIQYTLQNGTLLKGVYQLLNSNTLGNSINPLFPSNAQIKTHFFGAELMVKRIDMPLNPTKGFTCNINFAVGNRFSVSPTNKFNSTVYKLGGDFEVYQHIYKRNVLKMGLQMERYFADSMYSNERARTGGLNSIRGFNEEEIFASTKLIGTMEYRFLVDQLSYAFLFIDQGIMQDKTKSDEYILPMGLGIGFAYGTKLGTFALVGALGKFNQATFDFRESKIHFGYTAYF